MRVSGGRVSGSRKSTASSASAPQPARIRKIARQSAKSSTCAPSEGASRGAAAMMSMSVESMRAASAPEWRSRTQARAMTVAAPPPSAWRNRARASAAMSGARAAPALAAR